MSAQKAYWRIKNKQKDTLKKNTSNQKLIRELGWLKTQIDLKLERMLKSLFK